MENAHNRNSPPARTGPSALIRLGFSCNNNCVFCHSMHKAAAGKEMTTRQAMSKVDQARDLGARTVIFSGGEPTIRQDLPELLSHCQARNLSAGLITNARMFHYRDFNKIIQDIGLDYILISLHGPDETTHERMTRAPGSFKQTLTALSAFAGSAARVVVNTVVTTENARELGRTARLLENFAPLHFKISLPEPKGAVMDNFKLVMNPARAAESIAGFLSAHDPSKGVTVGVDGLTPCLLKDFFSLNDDFYTHGIFLISEPEEAGFFSPSHGYREFLPGCLYCSLYHLCPGMYGEYFNAFPGIPLNPLTRTVSNAIRFDPVPGEEVLPLRGGAPPCKDIKSQEPARELFLMRKDILVRYTTREAETHAQELMSIKFDLEQVYAVKQRDQETTGCPSHLRKLRLYSECRECPKRRLCPAIYENQPEQPFESLMELIVVLIEYMQGATCDIGCGTQPYANTIRDRITRGLISSYLGIDPSLPMEQQSRMHGRYILRRSGIEDLASHDGVFDTVAMFRSYNHIRDLRRALKALNTVTAPGSMLVLLEDLKLITLTNDAHAANTDRNGAFEHYRNHSAHAAAMTIERAGFKMIREWRPGKENAGVWAIVAEKQ